MLMFPEPAPLMLKKLVRRSVCGVGLAESAYDTIGLKLPLSAGVPLTIAPVALEPPATATPTGPRPAETRSRPLGAADKAVDRAAG
mgnify:CR=1 FL=1